MKPTERDRARAKEIMLAARVLKSDAVSDIARALAEVRAETIEECARFVELPSGLPVLVDFDNCEALAAALRAKAEEDR